jgi:hypothetical protein
MPYDSTDRYASGSQNTKAEPAIALKDAYTFIYHEQRYFLQ